MADFSLNRGAIRLSKRASGVLEGLFALIEATTPHIHTAFDVLGRSELKGCMASSDDTLARAYVHFCLACLYDSARRCYGNDEASLMVDALFARCFEGALPRHELFQEYISFPLFREEGDSRRTRVSLRKPCVSGGSWKT